MCHVAKSKPWRSPGRRRSTTGAKQSGVPSCLEMLFGAVLKGRALFGLGPVRASRLQLWVLGPGLAAISGWRHGPLKSKVCSIPASVANRTLST